jgi:hypothetical protein
MKFITIAALAICVATNQGLGSIVSFNQELAGDQALAAFKAFEPGAGKLKLFSYSY